jgi:hypothetical protein
MTKPIPTHDWPVTPPSPDPETVRRVLANFDRWHAEAVRSLAATKIPREDA